ncbi:hypothetical protein GO730_04005 [Spirosoma sp. HMF3257]|uniref:Uncharacterized protein n=1 Tax=Spirosoma telluris TaxID=2183553 RepID=A0A327NG37_9BACT|nr:hypothetical protein [Spirosoma telluris]RAI73763.1 hypothetical protein HMF3257_03945 [Spirosoma telluris]
MPGLVDGTLATLAANSVLRVDMGSLLAAGSGINITYSSTNTTGPLQVLVSSSATSGYTNIAQLPGSTSPTTYFLTLPVGAQYIQLVSSVTPYSVDAVTRSIYQCVTPISTSCPAGQVSTSYQNGAQSANGAGGTVSNAPNATGTPDGTVAALSAASSLTLTLASTTIAAGTPLYVSYSSTNVTAPLQVLVATSAAGPYVNIGQLPGSTSQVTNQIILPLNARYVQLTTTGTAFSVDAVTYPIYTCVTLPNPSCPPGQRSVSFDVGTQSAGTFTGTVSNGTNMTGTPDGAVGTLAVNSASRWTWVRP